MSTDAITRAEFLNHFDLDHNGEVSEAERDLGGRLFDALQAPDDAEDRDVLDSYEIADFFDDRKHAAEVFDGLRSHAHRTAGAETAAVIADPHRAFDAVIDAKAGSVARHVADRGSVDAVRGLEEVIAYLETFDGVGYAAASVSGDSETVGSDTIDLLDWIADEAKKGHRVEVDADDITDYATEYSLPGLAGLALRAQWRIDDMRTQLETLPETDAVIDSWIDDRDMQDADDRAEVEAEIDEYVRVLGAMDDAITAFPAMRRDAQGLEKLVLEVLLDQGAIDFPAKGREPIARAARLYRDVIDTMAERYALPQAWVSQRLEALGHLGVEGPALVPIQSLQPVGFPKR